MTTKISIDEKDEEIIRQFQRDGRQSNRVIGELVGLSEGAVRKRMKRLIESGAIGYGLVVDIQATEMGVSGYLMVEVTPAHLSRVSQYISRLDKCSLCMITTGKVNIRAYMYDVDQFSLAQTTATIAGLEGVVRVEFREAIYFTQHRYELIMMANSHQESAWGI